MKIKKILLVASAAVMLTSCGGTTYTNQDGNTLTLKGDTFKYNYKASGEGEETFITDAYTWSVNAVYSGSAKVDEENPNVYELTAKKLVINGTYTDKLGETGLYVALSLHGLTEEEIAQVTEGKKLTITYDSYRERSFVATVNPEDSTFSII